MRKEQCYFCTSCKCNYRIVSLDGGKTYDEVACSKHATDLDRHSDVAAPRVMKVFLSSTGGLERGENIDREMEIKKRLEDYAIRISTGRSYQNGFDSRGKKIWRYEERYKTNAGEFTPQEWREKIKEAIEQAGEMELLESLRNYCREHCAWLHKELEIEDYAMDVLARRAYLYWDGFKSTDKSKYMVFNFKEG